jgi:hypothetical protein
MRNGRIIVNYASPHDRPWERLPGDLLAAPDTGL